MNATKTTNATSNASNELTQKIASENAELARRIEAAVAAGKYDLRMVGKESTWHYVAAGLPRLSLVKYDAIKAKVKRARG